MLQGMNILYENNSLAHYYFPIVQWGTSDFGKENTFPINFNVLFAFDFSTYSTSGDYSNSGDGVDSIILINETKFKVNHGSNISNAKLFWIAIGN